MDFYENVNGKTLKEGFPVDQDYTDYPYVIVGEWWKHYYNNGQNYQWRYHGALIRLDKGMKLIVGDDGSSRVMSGELVYRENQLWLRPSDTPGALLLYKFNAPARKGIWSGKDWTPPYSRALNAENVEMNFQYTENEKTEHALMTLRAGSKLSVTETRTLRVQGTGASWGSPFNFKKEAKVRHVLTEVEFTGVSPAEIAASVAAAKTPEESVTVEAWTRNRSAIFGVRGGSEPGVIKSQAARALALDSPGEAKFKYEEVAVAA